MKITWLGHGGFRIEIEDQTLLLDPWLSGNPVFPDEHRNAAIEGATHILLTHGHGDHTGDALALTRETGAPLVGIYDLMAHWEATERVATVGFNKGGTVNLGQGRGLHGCGDPFVLARFRCRTGLCRRRGRIHRSRGRTLHLRHGRHRHHGGHGLDRRIPCARHRDSLCWRAFHDGHEGRSLGCA